MSTTETAARTQRLTGVQCMVLSAFFFSLMSLTVKVAGQRIPTLELMFARGALVTLIAGLDLARRRVAMRGTDTRSLLLRGMVGFLALGCFYYAVVHIPLAEATVIHFTNPLFTTLIAAAFLGERARPRELALTAAGLLGVAVMVRPAGLLGLGAAPLPLVPVAASIAAAVLAAVAYTLVRHLRRHDHMLIVFYFAGLTSLIALPLMLPAFVWPRGNEWLLLLAVGLTTLFGQIFLTLGLQRERAGRATAVGYVQIVFASVWGALFFNDLPRPATLLGAAVIVASTVMLARAPDAVPASPAPGEPPQAAR
jgi:drug/metabolite transporter (DMT)-like permease